MLVLVLVEQQTRAAAAAEHKMVLAVHFQVQVAQA
jgi:hypothetical protein